MKSFSKFNWLQGSKTSALHTYILFYSTTGLSTPMDTFDFELTGIEINILHCI